MGIGAIVLAAGKSERMGRPKALMPFRGRTFLEGILGAIAESKIQYTVTVLGHNHAFIQANVTLENVVVNPVYEKGMITSLQAGIQALPREVEGALIFLVDHPVIQTRTINALIASFMAGRIVLPTFQGRRGHPVLFARSVLDEVMALPESSGANTVVRRDPGRIIEVALDDPGILIDVDTPADFEDLRQRSSSSSEQTS